MALFEYKALAADGSLNEGQVDATGRQEALRQLSLKGLRPIRLQQAAAAKAKTAASAGQGRRLFESRKVRPQVLEAFMRQLSSLLAAGVPLSRALTILARESSSRVSQEQWKQIHDQVIDGVSLADAMARLPETFSRVYVAMVRAGEAGGFLDLVLNQIADFQARDRELRGRVMSALLYPAVLMVLAFGVMIFLMTFFIPRFKPMFEGFGGSLPALTTGIVATSEFILRYGLLVAAGAGVGIYAFQRWLKTDHGRRVRDNAILRIPVIGPLGARFAMTRFCRMLGTLVKSGVGLVTSLRVARDAIGNQTLIDTVSESIERVQKGDSLASSLADCPQLFPGAVIEMISVAEESGRMDVELMRLADETERELDGKLRMAVALCEPLLLFLIAGVIGTIFIGMVLPIFSVEEFIQ